MRIISRQSSFPINPLVQVPQNARRYAPDVSLAESDGVIMPRKTLPFTRMALDVRLIHEEGKRHLEGAIDLAHVELELEAGLDPRHHRDDTVTERGHVKIEVADRRGVGAVESDLLLRLAQRRFKRACIGLLDLAAGERNLPGMVRQVLRPLRQ